MPSNEIVMQTVRRMISSGVDDETIRMTLKGINIPDEEIERVIFQAKGAVQKPQPSYQQTSQPLQQAEEEGAESGQDYEESEEPYQEDDSEPDSGEGDKELEEDLEEEPSYPQPQPKQYYRPAQDEAAHHSTTHNLLEEHGQRMDTVQQGISDLHRKFDSAPRLSPQAVTNLNSIEKRIFALEGEIKQVKGNTVALQNLLKSVLETNRKILLGMKKK